MKLCEYCINSILENKVPWDYHHGSYTSLESSCALNVESAPNAPKGQQKKERCLFCLTLKTDVDNLAPHLKKEENTTSWPAYRWNIRSLSRTRESLEAVVVTFRYVLPATSNGYDAAVDVALPTRTFYLFPEEVLHPLPTLEQISKSTNPTESGGNQIRSWIETCDATHEDCMKRRKATPKAKRFVPTRLLDISGSSETPIRLIETASTSVQGPYCSLSHCWGPEPRFIKLLQDNKKHHLTKGVEWHLLPKNFQEAIEVARTLDVGYIWIDSLCIVQDSGADWDHEAALMHMVYRNSYCNIAIADAPDADRGAFRSRDAGDIVPVRYRPKEESAFFGRKTWAVLPENLWDQELLQSFLYARGWVFQERMLSPRILHFAQKQIFWDCPSLSACETLPAGLPPPMDRAAGPDRHWRGRLQVTEDKHEILAGANDQSMDAFWKTAVEKYTSCNLTKGRDKLIAMWGIAKLVRDAMNVEYGNGLFEENLEDQLAWRVAECKLEQRPSESTKEELARNIPSWSWASMDGKILVPDRLSDQMHFKVTDHDTQPLTFDLVGVKRTIRPVYGRAGAPPLPIRGISDSGPELQRRNKERERQTEDFIGEKDFHRSSSPEKIDRSHQPMFHGTSIRLQGHVGRGRLAYNKLGTTWHLDLDGVADGVIEAFPDVKPNLTNAIDASPYFIVLAAKQVIKPPIFALVESGDTKSTGSLTAIAEGDESVEDDFDYAGHGILMKDMGNDHFRRTGAFRFRSVDGSTYELLQQTYMWADLKSPKKYSKERGRKIWLD
ncbi:heterokaryon incompatibility protein-domain-containing protein [Paraphoma chrysanthemicola]|uniref:Heterokaryon incompatibility protein-domain-containing protein n=1 Tax=Paraphoma chrysanthemicola TaxID=798071 RepID=A0A8K0VY21_9PLEO|nr:heterokaryon incompatibility protein-domain-containing protein [Paraphoma chrysanthemicola]